MQLPVFEGSITLKSIAQSDNFIHHYGYKLIIFSDFLTFFACWPRLTE